MNDPHRIPDRVHVAWLLIDLDEAGVLMDQDDGELVLDGPTEVLTADLVARVRRLKPLLLDVVARRGEKGNTAVVLHAESAASSTWNRGHQSP
jgi:uncharacterized protein (DUF2336 family)